MSAFFFAPLRCHHDKLTCWFILAAKPARLNAGPVHASFSQPEHRQAWQTLPANQRLSCRHPALSTLAQELKQGLIAYLEGAAREFYQPAPFSPFLLKATPFQRRVWQQIAAIPYGETRTYGELGEQLGNRHLARAVGRACGANPCPLLIPCHRVVATKGLGGFSGGGSKNDNLHIKKTLLALEHQAKQGLNVKRPKKQAKPRK